MERARSSTRNWGAKEVTRGFVFTLNLLQSSIHSASCATDWLTPLAIVNPALLDYHAPTRRFARAPCLALDPRGRTCPGTEGARLLQDVRISPQLDPQRHRRHTEARTGEWIRGRRDRGCRRLYPEEPGAISR